MIGIIVVVGVLLIAVCTAGAFALRSVSRIWLRHLLERQPAGAVVAEHYLSRPQRLHAAAGGATALAAFAVGSATATSDGADEVLLWIVGAFTVVCMLGVAVPRGIARRWPTHVVPVGLPLLRAADLVLTPIRALAERTARPRARAGDVAAAPEAAARSDLEDLLREGQLEGVGDETELAIISGVVHFGGKRVGDVLTPRAQLFALDVATAPREIARAVAASGYSRVPLFRGTIDEVIGVVLAFDLFQSGGESAPPVRAVLTTTPDVACTDLLGRLLRAGLHLAVVRDAGGATAGIVTLDDLLEELVGDIRDEYDEPAAGEPTSTT